MKKDQLEVLNLVQEVLRAVVISTMAVNPEALPRVVQGLRATASRPGASPMAAKMLEDLATGLEMIESARSRKQ